MSEESRARLSCFPSSLKSKKKKITQGAPGLEICCMSWMIAELDKGMNYHGENDLGSDIP